MKERTSQPSHRPLVSRGGLLALGLGALAILGALMPLAQRRQVRATALAPSALSLRYLELGVDQRPADPALRSELARKQLQSGLLDKARQHTLLLCTRSDDYGKKARLLLIDIDRASLAAVDPNDKEARSAALTRLLSSMDIIAASGLDVDGAEQFAERYRELAQPLRAAELLDRLARQSLPDVERRIAAADAAWLEAGLPLAAAQLHAWSAGRAGEHGLEHARLAIERSRGAGDPVATRKLFEQMRSLYPKDRSLLEFEFQIAEEYNVKRALEIVTLLVKQYPAEPKYHRDAARLADATGQSMRALDEYIWLFRHGGGAQDRRRAIELARANGDLALVRTLLEGAPSRERLPAWSGPVAW